MHEVPRITFDNMNASQSSDEDSSEDEKDTISNFGLSPRGRNERYLIEQKNKRKHPIQTASLRNVTQETERAGNNALSEPPRRKKRASSLIGRMFLRKDGTEKGSGTTSEKPKFTFPSFFPRYKKEIELPLPILRRGASVDSGMTARVQQKEKSSLQMDEKEKELPSSEEERIPLQKEEIFSELLAFVLLSRQLDSLYETIYANRFKPFTEENAPLRKELSSRIKSIRHRKDFDSMYVFLENEIENLPCTDSLVLSIVESLSKKKVSPFICRMIKRSIDTAHRACENSEIKAKLLGKIIYEAKCPPGFTLFYEFINSDLERLFSRRGEFTMCALNAIVVYDLQEEKEKRFELLAYRFLENLAELLSNTLQQRTKDIVALGSYFNHKIEQLCKTLNVPDRNYFLKAIFSRIILPEILLLVSYIFEKQLLPYMPIAEDLIGITSIVKKLIAEDLEEDSSPHVKNFHTILSFFIIPNEESPITQKYTDSTLSFEYSSGSTGEDLIDQILRLKLEDDLDDTEKGK